MNSRISDCSYLHTDPYSILQTQRVKDYQNFTLHSTKYIYPPRYETTTWNVILEIISLDIWYRYCNNITNNMITSPTGLHPGGHAHCVWFSLNVWQVWEAQYLQSFFEVSVGLFKCFEIWVTCWLHGCFCGESLHHAILLGLIAELYSSLST